MDLFFDFVYSNLILVSVFVVFLVLFIRNEVSRGGQGITSQKLTELMNKEAAVVVDVRDKNEFSQGHIAGAINIPFSDFQTRCSELTDKTKSVIVACKMGQHSGPAGVILRKNGFSSVYRLTGGMSEWRSQNLPVVKK
tara:strand:+ start:261 stop:674 length:414 start_codon:yes stop_codon:yes gene_type:complete